jgi:beta-lactamase class A
MPPASTYKVGVLLEAARRMEQGRLSLDERLQLLPEDWADGAGVLQTRIGQYVSAGEALRLMIGISDNTAALAMLRRLGPDSVNADYAQLGLVRTRFSADLQPTTTAWEMATLLTLVTSGEAAGEQGTEYMLGLLAQDQPQSWIAGGTPPDTVVAHKSGQLPGVRNDAALVYTPSGPYALVVLCDNLADEKAGEALIANLAGVVYDHFAAWLGSLPTAASLAAPPPDLELAGEDSES